MEKLEVKAYTGKETMHHFYCDDCNKYLGKTGEYDDGWCPEFGEFSVKFGEYHIRKHLCDDCKEKFSERLEDALIELGFENN